MSWEATLLPEDSSVQDAVRSLNESALKIALVVSPEGVLLGTVSDGDIRRGLLRSVKVTDPIERILQRTPLVVPPEMGRAAVLRLMQLNEIQQVPVVNEQRNVVGLHLWTELGATQLRPNSLVVMAGGLGKRLRPHTEECPKPLLPVAGRPILEHIVERAKEEGFTNFVFAVQYLGHMIVDHFGDGSKWNVNIDYLREKEPLGTAGALGLLTPRPDQPIVVTNGDVLTDVRYSELLDFHGRYSAMATMAVLLHEWQHPFGVVETEGVDIVGFEEKPLHRSHVNAGVYVLEPAALDELREDEHCDMPTLFARLAERQHRTVAFPMHEPWLDVGAPADLAEAGKGAKGPLR